MPEPLEHISHLSAHFVRAPFERVLEESILESRRGMVDSDTGARHSWTFHLLHGEAARFGEPFGPEVAHIEGAPVVKDMVEAYPLRGTERLSQPLDSKDLTVIEEADGWLSALMGQLHAERLDVEVFSMASTLSAANTGPAGRAKFPQPQRGHWFQLCHGSLRRSVSAGIESGRWTFRSSGPVQPFEKQSAYRAKLKKNRLTRAMLFEYLQSFGVDAVRLFGDKAVAKSVLTTTDHEGEALEPLYDEGVARCAP